METPEELILNALNIAEGNGYPNIWRPRILDVKLQAAPDMFQEYLVQLSRTLLYEHDFAEKLFGETFKLNLQQAVMEDNPITYLREYFALDKKTTKK